MAGIYIHIPFCRSKCYYCDFYSITNTKRKTEFFEALIKEIKLRHNFLTDKTIETVYFGGGTPSLLTKNEINAIYNEIANNFTITGNPEITLEVNPDDITLDYVNELVITPVNRISMGIQSFFDHHLESLNRRHSGKKAIESLNFLKIAGYNNISLDLIYGLPNLSFGEWKINLKQAIQLNIQHISAYHLTIEPATPMGKWLKEGKIKEINENESLRQFEYMVNLLTSEGFDHYEISSFAKNGCYSQHNTSYWQNKEYLGIGPAAHSYNLYSRHWNIKNLNQYIESLKIDKIQGEIEILEISNKYNDYIITRLRTKWGIDLNEVNKRFGEKYEKMCRKIIKRIKPELIHIEKNTIKLSGKGLFVSDMIIEKLILV